MNQPGAIASLISSPAASFAQPFEMMCACHEKMLRTLALLEKLRVHLAEQGADEQARQAARDVMRYFDKAAPQQAALDAFAGLYAGHIAAEEQIAYPAAAALLDADAITAMGREMAARRGA